MAKKAKTKSKKQPQPETETPRLVALRIRNYGKIEAFDCEFRDGALTLFCADNEVGKTTALSAIAVCLEGPRSKALPAVPVREGADEEDLLLELNLGALTVKRTIVRGRWALDLRPNKKDAIKLTSGQAVLDEFIGHFLDSREFDMMGDDKQRDALRALAGLDFRELDARRAEYYARRTDVGRDIKRLTGALEELPEPAADGDEPQSVTELLAELGRRRDVNDNHNSKRGLLGQMRADAEAEIDHGQELDIRIAQLESDLELTRKKKAESGEALDGLRADGKKLAAQVELLKDLETTSVEAQIADAEAFAGRVADAKKWRGLRAELDEHEIEHETLTVKIKQADKTRAGAIAGAKYPIPGLEARDDGVYLDGLPWRSSSESKRQTASTKIGFALHPQLKAVLIRDGSLFGAKARAQLLRDAQECGGQIIMEVVSDDEEIRVVIEDGEVGP